MINKRILLFLVFLMCTISILYAIFAQYHQFASPCPLCIAQRIIIASVGLLALLFAIHNPQNILIRIYGMILTCISIFGIKVAAHHIWLINLPPDQQPTSCGIPLDILYKKIPLNSFIGHILKGDAECGKVNWNILGMNGPTAVIVLLSIIILICLYIIFASQNKPERRFFSS
ncbi:MAG: disulfide bond formation protein B [Neisseriaceae bacterium]|jgi:disulfide bond formation protein DsbB